MSANDLSRCPWSDKDFVGQLSNVYIKPFLSGLIQVSCTNGHLKPDCFFRLQVGGERGGIPSWVFFGAWSVPELTIVLKI